MGKFKDDKIKEDLAYIKINDPYELLSCFLIGEGNVYQEVAYSPINTDDYPLIEFRAPRNLYHESGMDILKNMREFTRCGFPPLGNLSGISGGLLEMHYKMALAYTHRGKHLML